MARFVAFLRGINVGGRVVKKEKLQEAFLSLGFQNVVTYKQSGNIIFETSASIECARTKIEEKLRGMLGYDVAVFIRTIAQLKSIIEIDPFKGQGKEGAGFLVTILTDPPPSLFASQLPLKIPKSTAQVISAKDREVFSVTHGGGEGALPNPFVESKLKVKATTRNMNVIREIVEKYG
jgi:uncharacterized protein (DUF1697 family)